MGLASSQARLLTLTARMHQIEYKAARLEAMKLQMANESRQVYEDYLNALDMSKVQVKTLTKDGSVTFRDLTNYADFVQAGFALVYNNSVYDGNEHYYLDGVEYFKDGTQYKDAEGNALPAGKTEADLEVVDKSFNALVANIIGSNDPEAVNIADGASFEKALTNMINSGWITIVQKDASTGAFYDPATEPLKFADNETSVAINTSLQEIPDEIALRKAEAKYEADMKQIDLKDRKYDSDLAAIENERNAIKQEMETLKTVSKDNVERTFKLFG